MATYRDVVTGDRAGHVSAGLPSGEAAVPHVNIGRRNPALVEPDRPPATPPGPPPAAPDQQQGDAVQAMQVAEAALALVNTNVAAFDRQLIAAIRQAHKTTEQGRAALERLERDIETAVTGYRLDTAMGAREFQSYLIGKLTEIIAVVGDANDSDESKRALAAALTALYNAQGERVDPAGSPAEAPDDTETGSLALDPYDEPLSADDLGLVEQGEPGPVQSTPAASTTPAATGFPSWGGSAVPSSSPLPGGLSLADLPTGRDRNRSTAPEDDVLAPVDDDAVPGPRDEEGEPGSQDEPAAPESAPVPDDTTVTLPNGQTVTAATPQLARVIQAAAQGTPIAEAFRQQGITIPPAGTAVADPIDPAQLIAGDLGMFTDRYALAISAGEALLDGQIQRSTNVQGPSFLGWQHPPLPEAAAPVAAPTTTPPWPTSPSAVAT